MCIAQRTNKSVGPLTEHVSSSPSKGRTIVRYAFSERVSHPFATFQSEIGNGETCTRNVQGQKNVEWVSQGLDLSITRSMNSSKNIVENSRDWNNMIIRKNPNYLSISN